MSVTKNMHYLSQMISRNFVEKDSPQTFLLYNPNTKKIVDRNINKLFSANKPWGQSLENVLSGNDYENTLAPILKDLANCTINRQSIVGPAKITECEFNAFVIEDANRKNALSKLFLQTALLQRSGEVPQTEVEANLSDFFVSGLLLNMDLVLVEINPHGNYAPLILTDGMLFLFLCPDSDSKTLGHICFMVPISEQRFLLWLSKQEDFYYFCQKYSDIHYLNLCRIEQHEKKCKIALAKNAVNEVYLSGLVSQIAAFDSHEPVKLCTSREWR